MAIHKDLPASECHEDKNIIGAGTADAGKVVTPSAVTPGVGVLRNLTSGEIVTDIQRTTGMSTSTIVVETAGNPVYNLAPNATQTVTVQLGIAATAKVKRVLVRNITGAGRVRVVTADTASIHGWTELWLNAAYDCIELITDGVEWFIISTNVVATGFQFVRDSQYTMGAPLVVTAGTRTKITIDNLGAGQENYKDPRYDFWDQVNHRIKFSKPGDVLTIRIAMRVSSAGTSNFFDLETSFPSANTNVTTEVLAKSGGVENRIIREYSFFVDDFAITQGYMEIWVTPNANMNFWGVSLLVSVNTCRPYGGNG